MTTAREDDLLALLSDAMDSGRRSLTSASRAKEFARLRRRLFHLMRHWAEPHKPRTAHDGDPH